MVSLHVNLFVKQDKTIPGNDPSTIKSNKQQYCTVKKKEMALVK